MPRPQRVQFAGAVYHLMNRGVRGEDLYTDAREHTHFLALLAETCARYEWLVGTYCLMRNHYHLLVTTPEPTVPARAWVDENISEHIEYYASVVIHEPDLRDILTGIIDDGLSIV